MLQKACAKARDECGEAFLVLLNPTISYSHAATEAEGDVSVLLATFRAT